MKVSNFFKIHLLYQEYTPIINFHSPGFAKRLFKSTLVSLHRICFPVAPFSLLLQTTDNVRPQHPPVCLTVWMKPFPIPSQILYFTGFYQQPLFTMLLHFPRKGTYSRAVKFHGTRRPFFWWTKRKSGTGSVKYAFPFQSVWPGFTSAGSKKNKHLETNQMIDHVELRTT